MLVMSGHHHNSTLQGQVAISKTAEAIGVPETVDTAFSLRFLRFRFLPFDTKPVQDDTCDNKDDQDAKAYRQ